MEHSEELFQHLLECSKGGHKNPQGNQCPTQESTYKCHALLTT
jgi:hypothetical protein